MRKIFRCGIIGSGHIATEHARDMQRCGTLVPYALCDVDAGTLGAMGDEFGVPGERRFSDYRQLLELSDVDAVIICTPNASHFPITRDAIAHGKAYALEKPAAMTAAEAKLLVEATRAKALPNMVCFSYRYLPAAWYAKQLLDSGALGTLHHVYAQYIEGKNDNEHLPLLWRYQKELAGSGSLGDLGSHLIDLARWFVGEFDSVTGTSGIIIDKRRLLDGSGFGTVDTEDYFHFMGRMSGHVSAMFAFTKFAWGRKNAQRIEVYGSRGGLIYTLEKGVDRLSLCLGEVYGRSGDWTEVTLDRELPGQMETFYKLLCGHDTRIAADIYDGYMAQVVIDELLLSAETDTWRPIKRQEDGAGL